MGFFASIPATQQSWRKLLLRLLLRRTSTGIVVFAVVAVGGGAFATSSSTTTGSAAAAGFGCFLCVNNRNNKRCTTSRLLSSSRGSAAAAPSFPKTARLSSSAVAAVSPSSSSSVDSDGDEDNDDPWAEYRNKNNVRDQVFSSISGDGGIKVTACTIRNLVNDAMIQHAMTATPSDALGRTIACSLLMANGIQDEQTVQITVNGTLPFFLYSY